jgi:beta-glucosidase
MFIPFHKPLYVSSISLVVLLFIRCQQPLPIVQPELGTKEVEIIQHDNFKFKDLNRNSQLDPYEDWRLSAEDRAEDLLSQMNLE